MELRGEVKGKENDRESTLSKSTISKCITSVQVEDITICIESC
jgi:hypothetical protein